MSDHIHIGDTVDVRRPDRPSWFGEIVDFDSRSGEPANAYVRCITAPDRPPGHAGIKVGNVVPVSVDLLTRAGVADWPYRDDGCDDVDVTGRVRPYHRHAATGEAHAHPGGGTAHTHQTPEQATNGLVITARAESGQADVVAAIHAASADPGPPCMRCGGDLLDHLLCAGPDGGPDEYRCLRDLAQDVLHDMQTSEPADDGDRVDPAWVEVFEALATAHARSLISHEGPIVTAGRPLVSGEGGADMTPVVTWASGRGWGKSQPSADVVTREQHHAEVEAIEAGDLVGTDSLTVFAVLRDIADNEPVTKHPAGDRPIHYCSSCSAGRFADLHEEGPFPHLVSCPWVRAVQIVGRGQAAPAQGGDRG